MEWTIRRYLRVKNEEEKKLILEMNEKITNRKISFSFNVKNKKWAVTFCEINIFMMQVGVLNAELRRLMSSSINLMIFMKNLNCCKIFIFS